MQLSFVCCPDFKPPPLWFPHIWDPKVKTVRTCEFLIILSTFAIFGWLESDQVSDSWVIVLLQIVICVIPVMQMHCNAGQSRKNLQINLKSSTFKYQVMWFQMGLLKNRLTRPATMHCGHEQSYSSRKFCHILSVWGLWLSHFLFESRDWIFGAWCPLQACPTAPNPRPRPATRSTYAPYHTVLCLTISYHTIPY